MVVGVWSNGKFTKPQKMYKCSLCGYETPILSQVWKHQRNVHGVKKT